MTPDLALVPVSPAINRRVRYSPAISHAWVFPAPSRRVGASRPTWPRVPAPRPIQLSRPRPRRPCASLIPPAPLQAIRQDFNQDIRDFSRCVRARVVRVPLSTIVSLKWERRHPESGAGNNHILPFLVNYAIRSRSGEFEAEPGISATPSTQRYWSSDHLGAYTMPPIQSRLVRRAAL